MDGEHMERGIHNTVWMGRDDHGRSMGSGIYLYRLIAGDKHRVGKLALIR